MDEIVMTLLDQVREPLGIDQESKNWRTLETVYRDKIINSSNLLQIERYSADWRELVSRLIREICYRRTRGSSKLHQRFRFIQGGKDSMLNHIDISKEALVLFGDGAEEIYVYQPGKKRVISKEMKKSLNKLLKERGISIGPAIKNCSLDQGAMIKRLAQELQEMQKENLQDELGLFYSVIQDGKVLRLKEFDKTKQALFVLGDQYEMEIYLYKLN